MALSESPFRRFDCSAGRAPGVQPSTDTLRSWRPRRARSFRHRSCRRSANTARSARPRSGDVLFRVGDARNPLIAIIEGEAAILDETGGEIVRHGASGFVGELNLLTGQAAYLTAIVTKPMRFIAVDRDELRPLLFEDAPSRRRPAVQLHGAPRGAAAAGRRAGDHRPPLLGADAAGWSTTPVAATFRTSGARGSTAPTRRPPPSSPRSVSSELPLVRLPGGGELRNPTSGEVSRRLGIGLELAPREEVDLLVVGAGPAGLGAAVYGASEGLDTLVVEGTALGGQAGTSRRIENYLGFPAGISGSELTSRAVTQARKFKARTATPYRAVGLEPGNGRHLVRLEEDHEVSARAVVLATGAEYRRLPVDRALRLRGHKRVLRSGAGRGAELRCEARRCGRRGKLGGTGGGVARPRRSSGDAAAQARRPARDDVRLPDTRARALRGRGPRPQRNRLSAWSRRRTGGGHAHRRDRSGALVPVPVPRRGAVHRLAGGCGRQGTLGASCSPALRPEPRLCSRRASRASTRRATCARAR